MYNRELQVIDNQEKAYLLGLFYADGNIGNNQTQSRITLNEKDRELLFHLKTIFPFFYIHFVENKHQVELGNYKKELREDFISNGCLPRKSFDNKHNLHVPNISDELLPSFIRGYYDGDGGCSVSQLESGKKTQKRVYIYSVSKEFLYEIQDILCKNNIYSTITFTECGRENTHLYKLSIKTSSYQTFYDFLYTSATIFMTRKKDKLEFILNNTNIFIKKETPNCKFCGSSRVVCDGWTYYKERRQTYLCKMCKRHFTAPFSSNTQSGEGELLED